MKFHTLTFFLVAACASPIDQPKEYPEVESGFSNESSGSSSTTSEDGTTTTSSSSSSEDTTTSESSSDSSGDETTSSGSESLGGSSGEEDFEECEFFEDFEGLDDGDSWPDPWFVSGGVDIADIQEGRGRIRPSISGYSLGRMGVDLSCVDVDISMTFRFTNGFTQGVGLYVRTNNGYLQETIPYGLGYAGFAQLFNSPSSFDFWKEVDGEEQRFYSEQYQLFANVDYRMRLRVTQFSSFSTLLQAKVWQADDYEPEEWTIEVVDATPVLQNIAGGIALDSWSTFNASGVGPDLFYDDILVTRAK